MDDQLEWNLDRDVSVISSFWIVMHILIVPLVVIMLLTAHDGSTIRVQASSCILCSPRFIWKKKIKISVFLTVKCAAFVFSGKQRSRSGCEYHIVNSLHIYHGFIVWFTTCNPNDKGLVMYNLVIGPIKFHWRNNHHAAWQYHLTVVLTGAPKLPDSPHGSMRCGRYLVFMFLLQNVSGNRITVLLFFCRRPTWSLVGSSTWCR